MNNKLKEFNMSQRDQRMPELKSGDIVKVHRKIVEGGKERVQIFEGMIIAINGKQSSSPMITVRKVSNGVGVEIVVPIFSPMIEKIEQVKRAKIRRSKLYYIREKTPKSLKLKYKELSEFVGIEKEEKSEEATEEVSEKREKSEVVEEGKVDTKEKGEGGEKKDKADIKESEEGEKEDK